MNVPGKITLFAAGLTAAFGVAAYAGSSFGPVVSSSVSGAEHNEEPTHTEQPTHTAHGGAVATAAPTVPGGLTAARDGYALQLEVDRLTAGATQELRFVVTGPDGHPLTDYTPTHDKPLHLIVAGRDLIEFHHVHPHLDEAGTWSVDLGLSQAGAYRVFADFKPGGQEAPITLGTDLLVSGDYAPAALPPVSNTSVVDGYTVDLEGALEPGKDSVLTLTVKKDGEPVDDLEPYLGAYGHLVALRAGDLAYLHVHPDGAPGDGKTEPGPEIGFVVDVPTTGAYRLFLDFQHEGVVRTAVFTQSTTGGTGLSASPALVPEAPSAPETDGGDHASTDHSH